MLNNSLETESENIAIAEPGECENWIVGNNSLPEPYYPPETPLSADPYRLFRFLTDLEDIIHDIPDDRDRLKAIAPLVRNLLTSSYWLQLEYLEPNPKVGWSVKTLYKEPDYPLTIQTVAWLPGHASKIHNHATWGLVALISGQEKNKFWQRSPSPDFPDRLELVGEQILEPGEIITFMPDAIHSVEAMGDEPTISFNLYGQTDYKQRYKFDIVNHTATNF